jgi:hypothetical protein
MPNSRSFRDPLPIRLVPLPALLLAGAMAACGDAFTIPPATQATSERIVVLYALTNTPISTPSAFNVITGIEVRTDRSPDFDFAIDYAPDSALGLGTSGDTVFAVLPRGALGFGQDAGVQVVDMPWDSVKLAPGSGYVLDSAVAIDSGSVVVASSRSQTCNFGLVRHLYAKFRVDQVDRSARRITTTMVTNPNCGYRSLQAGVPTQ